MEVFFLLFLAGILADTMFKDSKWGDAFFKAVCPFLLIIVLGILSLLILGELMG